jgi:glycosyltransferase involved in cell wall biosynthesis
MRVTHVITRLIVGGAQENTIASVFGLREKPGIEICLISGPSAGPEGSLESAFDHAPQLLTTLPSLVRPVHPWKDVLALRQLANLFRSQRPHIAHTHSGKAGVLGRLAAARAGVPIIVHTVHGPSFGPFQGPMANAAFRFAERYAGKVTSHFVVVAEAMKQQYVAANIGRPEQYSRIFSGFDLAPYLSTKNDLQLRARFGLGPNDIVVGKIARLFKLKGHDSLFAVAPELVKRCPQIKFLLVGDGEWRRRFEMSARSAGLAGHFIFTGLVPPTEVPALVGIMDAVVHLSLREGLPRALPQALAAGKPVVAFDCDGAREVCFDADTGFLVRPGDLPALTEAILRLAQDAGMRDSFGRRGQQFVRDHFGIEHMVGSLYHLYLKLAAERGL